MKGVAGILSFLIEASERGERAALVTITDIIGTSSRAAGTHMAVSETGAFAGSFSGGCIEAAVVGEARKAIEAGRAELIRFGAGSRFLDIRLPCGGGLDFLISPDPAPATIRAALEALSRRSPVVLSLGVDGSVHVEAGGPQVRTGWQGEVFIVRHEPELRIVIPGQGLETKAMARLGLAYGAEILVLCPDLVLVERLKADGIDARHMKATGRSAALKTDANTAVVMLFHDHDWETDLLVQALEQDAFFIGAMGSRRAHAIRIETLRERGVPQASYARIVGPIGLIPATRDPESLALSALSQVVELHARRQRPGLEGATVAVDRECSSDL